MSQNPANLVLRLVLELVGLVAYGWWGWVAHDGPARLLWSAGLVVGAAAVWGVFRVPNDGGPPVVTVSGPVRLAIEALYFAGAVAALLAVSRALGLAFAALVVAHYAVSYDRVARLLRGRGAADERGSR